jgi:hypothetical protein
MKGIISFSVFLRHAYALQPALVNVPLRTDSALAHRHRRSDCSGCTQEGSAHLHLQTQKTWNGRSELSNALGS